MHLVCFAKRSVCFKEMGSSASYMALFSKHRSSHYHRHMLLALSLLISKWVQSHLGRDAEGERESLTETVLNRCGVMCHRDMCGAHTVCVCVCEGLSRGLTVTQIGVWCGEAVLLKSLSWEMIAEGRAYLTLIVLPRAFGSTMTSAAPFYDERSLSSLPINLYCSLSFCCSRWHLCSRLEQLYGIVTEQSNDSSLTGHC